MLRIPLLSKRWMQGAETVAFASLLALVCSAPFESLEPSFRWAGLQITYVEVVLGSFLLLGGGFLLMTGASRIFRTQLVRVSYLLIAIMLVSTLFAETHRGDAIRFVGRFAAGVAIFLVSARLLVNRRRIQQLTAVVVATGFIVAVLAVAESLGSQSVSSLLERFKPGTFYVGGLIRASSTLQYPTIASMYLEIVFGFGLGLLLYGLISPRRWLTSLTFGSLLVVAAGILSTLTRGGLIALAAELGLVLLLYGRARGRDRGFSVLLALTILVAGLFLGNFLFNRTYRVRLATQNVRDWYKASFEVPRELVFYPGEIKDVPVSVANLGQIVWSSDGRNPCYISYHWMDSERNSVLVFEGHRSALPNAVVPGSRVHVKARVEAPERPGRYRIAWDVIQEHRLWFGSLTGISAYSSARVEGIVAAQGTMEGPPLPISESRYQLDRPTLWKAVLLILSDKPLTGVGPGNFRLSYGEYLGMEIWNRSLHANNTFLEFFAGTGVVGGVVYLWFWLLIFRGLIEGWKRRSSSSLPLLLTGVTSVIAIFVHGMVDHFFAFTPTYIMIWISFALAAASRNGHGNRTDRKLSGTHRE